MTLDVGADVSLSERLDVSSAFFYEELEVISPELMEWAERFGLSKGKTELRKVLARQVSFAELLGALLGRMGHDGFAEMVDPGEFPFGGLLGRAGARYSDAELDAFIVELKEAFPEDVLGRVYEGITPQDARRTLGQYWTPAPIAELMGAWAMGAGPRIIDPAVGSGRLIHALGENGAHRASSDDGRFHVRAHEISPIVFMIAHANATLADRTDMELDLRLSDFLTSPIEQFDAVVCNPPYTRHHLIPDESKKMFIERALAEFGVRLSGFASLFVYFFVRAISSVREGGRISFITPSELYEASYSTQFKKILRQNAMPKAIISFDKSHNVFDGVDTAGCITLAEKNTETPMTALIEVSSWPGTEVLLQVIESGEDLRAEWGTVKFVLKFLMDTSAKWSNSRRMAAPANALPPLGSMAKIVRGVATGANGYFCLSREEAQIHNIPEDYLVPVVTQTRTVQNYKLDLADMGRLGDDGRKVWLFTCRGRREDAPKEVRDYIESGERQKLHERSLLKLKKGKWYMVERREPPPILFTYLSRGNTRFIHNVSGAQALNVFLLVYPDEGISCDPRKVKAMTAILNSTGIKSHLHLIGRSYGGDTVKLEPRELDKLPILDPRLLTDNEITKVNRLFDSLCDDPTNADKQKFLDEEVSGLILEYDGQVFEREAQATLFE
ncbi:MAG: SAM-dependent methyltransferase [Actinomycetota bacterium]|jgi:predicted RNA methylase|nr:N-6 DNA methylase [Rubrobacter sp.]MDQ3506971.1 SAM-dependent methyltransferase [Actinomycetota bacterium]